MSIFVIVSTKQAVVLMVDANIQREEILPSERAFAFKMKLEALRRQGRDEFLDYIEQINQSLK